MANDDLVKAIYDQDCEFVRNHNGQMWNRFQTVTAIEAAMLYGIYEVHTLTPVERQLLSIVGSILVLLACLLAFTDRRAIHSHLERIAKIEEKVAITDHSLKFEKPKRHWARAFLWAILLLLTVSNFVVVLKLFCTP